MINFNGKKAIEIIEKYNLSAETLRVWKNRGKIPEKYFSDNYQKNESLTKSEKIQAKRIVDILQEGRINMLILSELCQIRETKLNEIFKGKAVLNKAELIALKTEFNRIKIEIAKTFSQYSERKFIDLLENPLLKYTKIIEDIPRAEGTDQVSYIRKGKHQNPEVVWKVVKDSYIVFAMSLSV